MTARLLYEPGRHSQVPVHCVQGSLFKGSPAYQCARCRTSSQPHAYGPSPCFDGRGGGNRGANGGICTDGDCWGGRAVGNGGGCLWIGMRGGKPACMHATHTPVNLAEVLTEHHRVLLGRPEHRQAASATTSADLGALGTAATAAPSCVCCCP